MIRQSTGKFTRSQVHVKH